MRFSERAPAAVIAAWLAAAFPAPVAGNGPGTAAGVPESEVMPVRPVPAVAEQTPVPAAAASSADVTSPSGGPTRESVCGAQPDAVLRIRPGENQIVPVSRGHLNRIVTPFESPRLRMVDETSSAEVHENVIYFATNGEAPVSLFVLPPDGEEHALSLTLIPCAIPPRELRLALDGPLPVAAGGQARRWEEGQPYEDGIRALLEALALGRVPQGYGLRSLRPSDPRPACALPWLRLTPGQVVEGHRLLVVVAAARNASDAAQELTEPACAGPDVAAVAAWPRVYLAPGQETELFVVLRRPEPAAPAAVRASLIR